MDRIKLAPIIRGAYLDAGCLPFVQALDTKGAGDSATVTELRIPSLKALLSTGAAADPGASENALSPADLSILGKETRTALAGLRNSDGSFPGRVQIDGVGDFSVTDSPGAADSGSRTTIRPRADSTRNDVVRGRISLVTGGAQGFGAEIVKGLIDAGSFVFIADINKDGAESFASQFNQDGRKRAAAIAVDVSNEDSVKAMADEIVRSCGGLDLLVSNAGVLRAGSVLELSARDFDFVTKINYSAFFLVVKHLAPIMVGQQAAAPNWAADIIQINSKSGLVGSNKNGAYAGGKFGGIGLVQSFAMELVEYRIKVNAICPGNFFDGPLWSDPDRGLFVQYLNAGKVPGAQTIADVKKFYEDKVPMGRGCEGEDVMKAIFYCVDQEYETGQAVPVTGGQVMLK